MSESTDEQSRKKAEQALFAEQRFIDQLAQLAPVQINVFDLQTGRDIYIGPDVRNMLGYTRDEIARMDDPFALWHPEDANVGRQYLARLGTAADGEISEFEFRARHRDGDWRWLLTRSVPFR
jgi:PAS domain S-box-containing protein